MADSYAQLEGYWIQAGGPKAVAPIAAAIAMAEDAGQDSIQQGQPYATTGWGDWQITPGNSEPQIGTDQQLLNPLTNAKAAVAKYEQAGNSFAPWTTFTSGKYLQFLQGNVPAANTGNAPTPASTTGIPGLSWPTEITTFFQDSSTFVDKLMWLVNPSSWLRIAAFLVGIVLLLFAIHALIASAEGAPIMPQMPNIVPVPVLWPLPGVKLSPNSTSLRGRLMFMGMLDLLPLTARDWSNMLSRSWAFLESRARAKNSGIGSQRYRLVSYSRAIWYSRNSRATTHPLDT